MAAQRIFLRVGERGLIEDDAVDEVEKLHGAVCDEFEDVRRDTCFILPASWHLISQICAEYLEYFPMSLCKNNEKQ